MSQFLQAWFARSTPSASASSRRLACLDNMATAPALLIAGGGSGPRASRCREDYLIALGTKVVMQERDFNRRAGFTTADDRLPAFMTTEPVSPSGLVFDVADADMDAMFA